MAGRHEQPVATIDLDLVAASYRSLADPAAFETLIEAWNRKLAQVDGEADWSESGLGPELFAHLTGLEALAERAPPLVEDPIRNAVETRDAATMVQSPDGRVVAMNAAAERQFGARAGAIDPLHWLDPAFLGELSAIRRAAVGHGNRQRAILRFAGGEDEAPDIRLIEASLLRAPSADQGFVLLTSLALHWSKAVGDMLAEAFALTDAEVEVVRLFHKERDLQSIARDKKVSLATVRTQFKTVLSKTGAANQASLLHIVSMLCAREAARGGGKEMGWADPFGNERILIRPCGKRLAYSWTGTPDGAPILWVHGPGFNGVPPRLLVETLAAAGKRLIFVSRPGYGNSDRDPAKSIVEDQVSALVDLAEMLDLRDCPAVGTTSGAQALHLARDRVPDRIGTCVAISFSWKATAEEIGRLPIIHRTMYRLALRAPSILRSLCSIGLRIVHHSGPDWFVQRAHGQYSGVNQKTMRDPEVQALLRSDCRMMLAHGPDGFIADLTLAHVDTRPALERATAPTLWLMGTEDQHFVTVDRVCATLPGLRLRVIEGCSELMLYQRPDLVARAVLEAADGP